MRQVISLDMYEPDDLVVVDLIEHYDEFIYEKFCEELKYAVAEDHPNSENYIGLETSYKDNFCWHVVYDTKHENIVTFSGLFNDGRYNPSTARLANRTYINPQYRGSNGMYQKDNRMKNRGFTVPIFIPKQIEVAKRLGLDSVFISIEHPRKRKMVQWLVDQANKYNPNQPWELLDGLYNTCPLLDNDKINNSKKCWQNIAYCSLADEATFDLPGISLEEWTDTAE